MKITKSIDVSGMRDEEIAFLIIDTEKKQAKANMYQEKYELMEDIMRRTLSYLDGKLGHQDYNATEIAKEIRAILIQKGIKL